jgi:glycosidase
MTLRTVIKQLNNAPITEAYIPTVWTGEDVRGISKVSYPQFLVDRIYKILELADKLSLSKNKNWTHQAVIYNLFPRHFTAFDHDQDGKLGDSKEDITCNNRGLRETGTFLKTIALLPYLKSLGINTIHLLPITKVGEEGRKGDLGSPYAIKNPYTIDPLLADPIVDIDIKLQYRALVQGAHMLGMRVVQEFIFRTASIDSDWIASHPNWFYWLKKDVSFEPPKFQDDDLKKIKKVPKGKGQYIPPPVSYREKFENPPEEDKHKLKVASAFADWPPDDLQPPWTDVTYLRMYHYDYSAENNYNYIAYNTIRYYDPQLATPKNVNKKLWQAITGIISYYQENFGINGAMIDMGHALPNELKKQIINKARSGDPHFAFWDENFENRESTKNEGYDAVIGGSWYNITKRNGFKKEILKAQKSLPLPYFGTAETHNSPRYGVGHKRKKMAAWVLFNILPQAIPFLHNGFELDESLPVNTGLNFSQQDLDKLQGEQLALFYKSALHWDSNNIIPFVRKLNAIKKNHTWIFDRKGVEVQMTSNPKILGLKKNHGNKICLALFNTNFYRKESFSIEGHEKQQWLDLLEEKQYKLDKDMNLPAGRVVLLTNI